MVKNQKEGEEGMPRLFRSSSMADGVSISASSILGPPAVFPYSSHLTQGMGCIAKQISVKALLTP